MKLTALYLFAISLISIAYADASTIRIDYNNGKTEFLTEDGTVQSEYFTREQDPQAYCLAENIYFEARNESLAGQAAVADVVLNRVHDRRYPETICEVVQEGPVKESWKTRQTEDPNDAEFYPIKNRCQFSWYCDGKEEVINNHKAWIKAQYIAYQMIYADRYRGITEGATHYHADYVKPAWAETKTRTIEIEDHIFYRWEK